MSKIIKYNYIYSNNLDKFMKNITISALLLFDKSM